MKAMKTKTTNERPILFSAEMVRAILAGRKTQTRRVVKCSRRPVLGEDGIWYDADGIQPGIPLRCPYGQPGDRLWVKETHLPTESGVYYRADFSDFDAAGHGAMYGGWKPSIFCRRSYSRLTLRIESVRVERLQDISEADALAEGVTVIESVDHGKQNARKQYAALWESINGAGSWSANPWVWVIEFEREENQ